MSADFGPRPVSTPELLSFDCAHTLLRANWNPAFLAVECLEACGFPVNRQEAADSYQGRLRSGWAAYQQICRHADPALCDDWWRSLFVDWATALGADEATTDAAYAQAFARIYEPGGEMFGPYADTLSALERLREAGFRMVVVSNWDATLRRHLETQGLSDFFEAAHASLEFGVEKPDPRFFLHAAAQGGVAPEQVMHIGDNPLDDLQGARDAGMMAVLIDRGRDFSRAPLFSSLTDFAEWLCS